MTSDGCEAAPSRQQGVLSNFLSLLVGSLSVQAINFCYQVYAARSLGPDNFGTFSFIIAIVVMLGVCVSFGRGPVIIREIAVSDAARRHCVIRAALWQHLLISSVGALLLCGGSWFIPRLSSHLIYIGLAAGSLVAVGAGAVLDAYFKGARRMAVSSVSMVLRVVTKAVIGVALLWYGLSVLSLFVALLCSDVLATVFLVVAYHLHTGRWPLPGRRAEGRMLLYDGAQIALSDLTGAAFNRFDWIFLGSLKAAATVGVYSAAYRFFEILIHVPGQMAVAAFPTICESEGRPGDNRPQLILALKLAVLPGCVACAFLYFWAAPVILLVLGPAYAEAPLLLQVLGLSLPFHGACGILYHLAIARRRQRYLVWSSGACALANILLCLLLIPRWGGLGAAMAMVLPSVLQVFLLALAARETASLPGVLWCGVKAATVATVIGVNAHALSLVGCPWPATLGVALVLVAPAVWAWSGLDAHEKQRVLRLVQRLLGRPRLLHGPPEQTDAVRATK
ncbi:MAG TPA: flippase [Phycisphaerae bacterium]|nr:flippase [Phycisphaerae bacterium]